MHRLTLALAAAFFVGACSAPSPEASTPAQVYWNGPIYDGADRAFHGMIRPGSTIVIDSYGGDMYSSFGMGRRVMATGSKIIVAENASCNSACVFVLLGASGVRISPSATIAIHRPSMSDDFVYEDLREYVLDMGGSQAFADLMWSIPNSSQYDLSPGERARYLPPAF